MDQGGASLPPASTYRDALLQAGGPKAPGATGGHQLDSHAARAGLSEEGHAGTGQGPPAASQDTTTVPASRCVGDLITGPGASHWRHLLVRNHLIPDSRLALYRTCTAARDLMLVTADRATARVTISEPVSLPRLHQVRQGLQLRGRLRTKLRLEASSSHMFLFAVGVLEAGTTWLAELHISIQQAQELMHPSVLPAAGRCWPHLQSLGLDNTPPELPSPDHFPKLKDLCIWDQTNEDAEPFFRIAAPYITQLTQLRLYPRLFGVAIVPPSHQPHLLFNPGTIATHLRILHLPVALDDTLLGLVLEGAPALQQLTVCTIWLKTDTHAQAQVQWRELWTDVLHLTSLAHLPVGHSMELSFNAEVPCPSENGGYFPTVVCDIVGGEVPAAAARLKKVWMDSDAMAIVPGDNVSVEDQPAALRVAFSMMRAWGWKDSSSAPPWIRLSGWTMSSELMLELPRLPHFRKLFFEKLVWLPGPLLYTTLLLLPQSYYMVSIYPARLTKDQVESICLGDPANRTTALWIMVHGVPDLVETIQRKMREPQFPNVMVRSWV